MSPQQLTLSKRVEKLLIPALFGAVGVYALYTSFGYPWSAQVWPLMVSVVLVVGCGLLLFQNYLPGPLAALTNEERIIGSDQELDDSLSGNGDDEVDAGRLPISPSLFTAVTIVAYAIVGYLVGLLWATPLFVAVYLEQFERPRWLIVFLTLLTFGLAYAFMEVLYLSIDSGVLFPGVGL